MARKPKTPEVMDFDTMREVLNTAGEEAVVRLWFLGADDYSPEPHYRAGMQYVFRSYDRKTDFSEMPVQCNLAIFKDTHLDVTISMADSDCSEYRIRFEENGYGDLDDVGGLWAVELIKEGVRKVHLESIGHTMSLSKDNDTVAIGCQRMNEGDALKAHEALGNWLTARGKLK
jgi:hypothetical protein